jgi:hypothetical protein
MNGNLEELQNLKIIDRMACHQKSTVVNDIMDRREYCKRLLLLIFDTFNFFILLLIYETGGNIYYVTNYNIRYLAPILVNFGLIEQECNARKCSMMAQQNASL